jgi:hypothetical protein
MIFFCCHCTTASGVAMIDIRTMLSAIQKREEELCKQGTKFGPWSGCTKLCGGGMRYRFRDSVLCVKIPTQNKPVVIKKSFEQHQLCNIQKCTAGAVQKTGAAALPSLKRPP